MSQHSQSPNHESSFFARVVITPPFVEMALSMAHPPLNSNYTASNTYESTFNPNPIQFVNNRNHVTDDFPALPDQYSTTQHASNFHESFRRSPPVCLNCGCNPYIRQYANPGYNTFPHLIQNPGREFYQENQQQRLSNDMAPSISSNWLPPSISSMETTSVNEPLKQSTSDDASNKPIFKEKEHSKAKSLDLSSSQTTEPKCTSILKRLLSKPLPPAFDYSKKIKIEEGKRKSTKVENDTSTSIIKELMIGELLPRDRENVLKHDIFEPVLSNKPPAITEDILTFIARYFSFNDLSPKIGFSFDGVQERCETENNGKRIRTDLLENVRATLMERLRTSKRESKNDKRNNDQYLNS